MRGNKRPTGTTDPSLSLLLEFYAGEDGALESASNYLLCLFEQAAGGDQDNPGERVQISAVVRLHTHAHTHTHTHISSLSLSLCVCVSLSRDTLPRSSSVVLFFCRKSNHVYLLIFHSVV